MASSVESVLLPSLLPFEDSFSSEAVASRIGVSKTTCDIGDAGGGTSLWDLSGVAFPSLAVGDDAFGERAKENEISIGGLMKLCRLPFPLKDETLLFSSSGPSWKTVNHNTQMQGGMCETNATDIHSKTHRPRGAHHTFKHDQQQVCGCRTGARAKAHHRHKHTRAHTYRARCIIPICDPRLIRPPSNDTQCNPLSLQSLPHLGLIRYHSP